jgi:hypothetical protein
MYGPLSNKPWDTWGQLAKTTADEHLDSTPEFGRAAQRSARRDLKRIRDDEEVIIDDDDDKALVSVIQVSNNLEADKLSLEKGKFKLEQTKMKLELIKMMQLSDEEKNLRITKLYDELE